MGCVVGSPGVSGGKSDESVIALRLYGKCRIRARSISTRERKNTMAVPKILAFAGSLRTDSWNKKLVKIAIAGARAAGAEVDTVDLREYALPLYDGDLEAREFPETVKRLKKVFIAHDGLLISSPEYNSSIPGVLKNAIDWLSRPLPDEPRLACFMGKTASIMAASPGALGGIRMIPTLRSILLEIGTTVLPDYVCVGKAHEAFTPEGALKDAKQHASIEKLGANLAKSLAKSLA
jgi:NAD(P)H-dependent FMN reductase